MNKIELLRNKLHEAINKENKQEILFFSRKLDKYIVQKTKELIIEKK